MAAVSPSFTFNTEGLVPLSMSEFAHQTLRQEILGGTLAGGTRLVIATVAQSLGVSSTPLREALRELANEGLVVLDARRGAEVRTIDLEEARKASRAREAIEPLLVAEATAIMTDDEKNRLRELTAQMEQTEQTGDFTQWPQLNALFHGGIADAAKWEDLGRFYRSLHAKSALHVGSSLGFDGAREGGEFWVGEVKRANVEHADILAAIVVKDPDTAARLMAEHISATFRHIEEFSPESH